MSEIAIITIDKFLTQEPAYVKFKDKSQKTWHCKSEQYAGEFREGSRYKVGFNTSEPKDGRKYGSRWINQARLANADEHNTWPDKEPYRGNGGGGNGSSGVSTGEFRTPEQIQRAHVLSAIAAWSKAESVEILITECDMALKWCDMNSLTEMVDAAAEKLGASVEDDEDIPF